MMSFDNFVDLQILSPCHVHVHVVICFIKNHYFTLYCFVNKQHCLTLTFTQSCRNSTLNVNYFVLENSSGYDDNNNSNSISAFSFSLCFHPVCCWISCPE